MKSGALDAVRPPLFRQKKKKRREKRRKGEERREKREKKEGEEKGKLCLPIIGRKQEHFGEKKSQIKSRKDTKDLCFRALKQALT